MRLILCHSAFDSSGLDERRRLKVILAYGCANAAPDIITAITGTTHALYTPPPAAMMRTLLVE